MRTETPLRACAVKQAPERAGLEVLMDRTKRTATGTPNTSAGHAPPRPRRLEAPEVPYLWVSLGYHMGSDTLVSHRVQTKRCQFRFLQTNTSWSPWHRMQTAKFDFHLTTWCRVPVKPSAAGNAAAAVRVASADTTSADAGPHLRDTGAAEAKFAHLCVQGGCAQGRASARNSAESPEREPVRKERQRVRATWGGTRRRLRAPLARGGRRAPPMRKIPRRRTRA